MADSAGLKIDRAREHVTELNALFQKQRPFVYVLETDTKTGQRATFAIPNQVKLTVTTRATYKIDT